MNYSFQEPGDAIPDGSVINSGNFSQLVPGTAIMVGKTLTINGGNFTNVKKQPEWTINGGNFTQVDRCSHLNESFVEHGLAACVTECKHMISKDTIEIDGVLIDTVYTYADGRV